jgi:hypothetical protein
MSAYRAYAPYLPKLKSPNSSAALTIESGACLALFFAIPAAAATIAVPACGNLQAPHHLVLDRLLVTIPASVGQKRAIALNSGATQVLGCYLRA